MREWNDSNRVEVLNVRETITESAVIDEIAHAANRLAELILCDLSIHQLGDIIDVETTWLVLEVRSGHGLRTFRCFICDCVWLDTLITDGVEIGLVDIMASSDIEIIE